MSYLTKAVLCRNASSGALAPLLFWGDESRFLDTEHRLVWSLFPGRNERRDFLWRTTRRGEFLVLSERKAVGNELFDPLITKPFEADLKPGDVLKFELRANATTVLDALPGVDGEYRSRARRLRTRTGPRTSRRFASRRASTAARS